MEESGLNTRDPTEREQNNKGAQRRDPALED